MNLLPADRLGKMPHESCPNEVCLDQETQLRLARLREELLTNFNTLLIERIRFLEQTLTRLSLLSTPSITTEPPPASPSVKKNLLSAPSTLRRSSSVTTFFLQSPVDSGTAPRSCPSSVDLSSKGEQRRWFSTTQKPFRKLDRAASESTRKYLSTSMHRQWTGSASDLLSSIPIVSSDRGRLELRRFACDVDDNDVRALKAMIYMEQARKQHARPLNRLRQVLRITNTVNQQKKHTTDSWENDQQASNCFVNTMTSFFVSLELCNLLPTLDYQRRLIESDICLWWKFHPEWTNPQ